MRKNTLPIALVCLAIVMATLLVPVLSFSAAAGGVYEKGNNKYDYSSELEIKKHVMNSAELLEYIGVTLGVAERDYIAERGHITLRYDNGVSTGDVSLDYDNEDGRLTLNAFEYSYTSSGGTEVVWIPDTVTVGERTESFVIEDEKVYKAFFADVAEDDSLYAAVSYRLDVTVSREDINSILNLGYNDAPRLAEEINEAVTEYETKKAEYDRNLIAYENYLIEASRYAADLAAYNAYLRDKAIYDDAYAKYQSYLELVSAYEAADALYREYEIERAQYETKYAAYTKYLAEEKNYRDTLLAYEEYLPNIAKARAQLGIIEATKTPMTNGRQIYSAIFGNMVDKVLENTGLLVDKAGVPETVIVNAGHSTEKLRDMLATYFSYTEESDKYIYYLMNYEDFRDEFTTLLQCLDYLYSNAKVKLELKTQGIQQKYIILVAQLAIVSNALNGGPVSNYKGTGRFDASYKIEGKTIAAILENKSYIDEPDDPSPLVGGYPEEVILPEEPVAVEHPGQAPTEPPIPVPPQVEVESPGEPPITVERPEEPKRVEEPVEPLPYTPPALEEALVSEYEDGVITEREEISSDVTVRFYSEIKKKLFNAQTVVAVFYVDGAMTYRTEVESGTEQVIYAMPTPTKAEDKTGSYVFAGWKNRTSGERVDLGEYLYEDVELEPIFDWIPRKYPITFDLGFESRIQYVDYGKVPEFVETVIRGEDEYYEYTFVGWDREFSAVNGEAEYTAVYDKTPIMLYDGDRVAKITVDDNKYTVDCHGASGSVGFDISPILMRLKRDADAGLIRGVTLGTAKGEIYISFSTALSMYDAGHTVIVPYVEQVGVYGYNYSVDVLDKSGRESDVAYSVDVYMPCAFDSDNQLTFGYESSEGKFQPAAYRLLDGRIFCSLRSGMDYTLSVSYNINVMTSPLATIVINGVSYTSESSDTVIRLSPGTRVNLSIITEAGVRLDRIFIIEQSGEELGAVGSFDMPSRNLSVGVECSSLSYTVTFVAQDNKIIGSGTYKHGDKVKFPQDPDVIYKDGFDYEFRYWVDSKGNRVLGEVIATGDMTYYATYRRTVYVPPVYDSYASPEIMPYLVALETFLMMLRFVVIPSVLLGIVLFIFQKVKRR